ncbi:AIPR family protein [Streptosporangium sp. DT93]|uniref:AIPR family protein n=1 Tax=Streptosporangium sp. DT93 TaxID=3393428 RepID=UPI003619FF1B
MSNPPHRQQSLSDRHISALVEVLRVLPKGNWTTYGEIAKLLNTSAIVVGRYMTDSRIPNPYRVLNTRGEIATGFHWGEHARSDAPQDLLEREGVAFSAEGRAAKDQRVSAAQLRDLLGDRHDEVLGPVARRTPADRRRRPVIRIQPLPNDDGVAAMEQAIKGRADLRKHEYGTNGRLLFAAELILDISDIHTVAAEALIDGGEDKSCDFLYVDPDAGLVVLAQGYEAEQTNKDRAPQKKAASLHQAAAWIFTHDIAQVPQRIRPAVEQVRQEITDGMIREVRIWYVHNLPESKHVADELAAVETLVSTVLDSAKTEVDVRAEEIGRNTLAAWYRTSVTPILVTEEFGVDVEFYLETDGPKWKAHSVTVPASWLQGKYWEYGDRLFSANVRGFLGKRKKVNADIRRTLKHEPYNFWIFNNGVTALVNDAKYDPNAKRLLISGLSIVNGAQTTGALGEFEDSNALADAWIPMRFITCADRTTVRDIIRFTNQQNPTEPSDFRSNDAVQRRLVKEFDELGVTGYTGGRRGIEPRRTSDLDVETTSAAKALVAFHGQPGIALHSRGRIWEDDALYGRLFSSATSASHILFCWGLLRAVEQHKGSLLGKSLNELPTGKQNQREFFNRRGSIPLMVTAVGDCMEDLLDRKITHSFRLKFHTHLSAAEVIGAWRPVVAKLAPFAHHELGRVLDKGALPRDFDSKDLLKGWSMRVQPIAGDWKDLRDALRNQIVGWR